MRDSEELKPCPLCGSYIITEDVIERLRMAHKEQGQHGDPVGEPGDNPFELSKRSSVSEKEYIERGPLLEALKKQYGEELGWQCTVNMSDVAMMIEDAPAADVVEVRHGEWKDNHCTLCGMTPIGEELWKHLNIDPPRFEFCMPFCPTCGAKMDGERKEQT